MKEAGWGGGADIGAALSYQLAPRGRVATTAVAVTPAARRHFHQIRDICLHRRLRFHLPESVLARYHTAAGWSVKCPEATPGPGLLMVTPPPPSGAARGSYPVWNLNALGGKHYFPF